MLRLLSVMTLGLGLTVTSCHKDRENRRNAPSEEPNPTLALVGENCRGSFTFHDEGPRQQEVVPPPAEGIDMAKVEELLKGPGLEGRMHASIPKYQTWVLNYQQGNFFNFYEFPLAIADDAAREVAKTLERHDKVIIKGSILPNGAAQKHILVTSLKVVDKYKAPAAFEVNPERTQETPRDLIKKNSALVAVHAISEDGKSLVVEYRDMVIQVVVGDASLTRDLYRNDKIKIHYKASIAENRPLHLVLDESVAQPIEMVDRLVSHHQKVATVEGCLVWFPASPMIRTDVYALVDTDETGLIRTWTLVGQGETENVFAQVTEKLTDTWASATGSSINFRNKMLNRSIRVRATGTLNITSANQANPQILITDAKDLELTVQQ